MTKDEILKSIKALKESNALNVKKAEDTLQNIDAKEVSDAKVAQGITGLTSELPTQKDVEKEVNKDEGPIVPADKDGVSKNGGESDKLEDGKVEAERKKEDNGMKDVINVSDRKVEENAESTAELLNQLKEAAAREEKYKKEVATMKKLCEEAIKMQGKALTELHAKKMHTVFEAIVAKGEALEKEMNEAKIKNEKLYKSAQKLYEGSTRLNKILLEAVKKAQPEKKMTRYMSASARAMAAFNK